ncbi:MAG: DUF3892 domain-containing protein [Rhodospirillales bacterium]|nr:DUF3892 domain-containing protein [Rhodospirillales bacterium]
MSDHQVSCVNKQDRPNPHERIVNIGGRASDGPWKLPQEVAIAGMEDGRWRFYTSVGGKSVWLIIATSRYGHKYLKTQADGEDENNLLYLPECP